MPRKSIASTKEIQFPEERISPSLATRGTLWISFSSGERERGAGREGSTQYFRTCLILLRASASRVTREPRYFAWQWRRHFYSLSLCLEYVEAGIDFHFASRLESCDSLTSATLLRRAGATPSLWSLLSSLICRGRRVPLRVRVIDCDERDVGLFLALPPRGCLVIRSNSSLGLIVFCSMCRLWVGMLQGMEIRFIELEI